MEEALGCRACAEGVQVARLVLGVPTAAPPLGLIQPASQGVAVGEVFQARHALGVSRPAESAGTVPFAHAVSLLCRGGFQHARAGMRQQRARSQP
jgi:hypothetical protein